MNNKQEPQPVQYTGEMYPTYSNPVYYSQPVHSAPASLPPTGVAPQVEGSAASAIPIKLVTQGVTQVFYLSPAQPSAAYNPLMLAHLPTLQFTSEAAASATSSVPVTISHDVSVVSATTVDTERLVNTTDGSSAPVASPESDQLPKPFRYFVVLGLISLAVAIFFFVHTPVLSNSSRMTESYCYTYYTSRPTCYTYPKYWVLNNLNGFGYTAASVSILVAGFCFFQGAAKKKSVFAVASYVALLFEILVNLFFVAALIVVAISTYDYGVDTLMGYIVALLIHAAILISNAYTIKRQGLTFSAPEKKKALFGMGLSGFNCLIGLTGFILTAVTRVWLYTTAPAVVFILASTTGLVAHAMLTRPQKNLKVISVLLKISAAGNWMIGGTAIFLTCVGILAPFVFGITIPIAILAIANAVHAGATLQTIYASPSTL